MKISRYLTDGKPELAKAVAEMAALYNISTLTGKWRRHVPIEEQLPLDAVLIHNKVNNTKQLEVITEVFFWRETGVLGCTIKRAKTDSDGLETSIAGINRLVRLNVLAILKKLTGCNPSPWGILRGVRPTKLAHRLLDAGFNEQQAAQQMAARYGLEPDKAQLVCEVAVRQRPILEANRHNSHSVSIYIGIPYCPSRCLYCSFPANVLPAQREAVDNFLAALERDIEAVSSMIAAHRLTVQSLYIGGGTPTSLINDDFARLLAVVKAKLIKRSTIEFTVEAGRPDSITEEKIQAMAAYGVTRTSVNPQTMQQKTLKHIGRMHTIEAIIDIFHKMRKSGIPVINMDVIAGLPGEDEQDVEHTMEQIASLRPDNLTIHTLAVKRGSILDTNVNGYLLPDENTTRKMVGIATAYARQMGMKPYYLYRQKNMTGNLENVGYAMPGTECIYNIQMMEERQTIIGIGPAAGTKAVASATFSLESCYNPKDVTTYINSLEKYIHERQHLLARLFANHEEE